MPQPATTASRYPDAWHQAEAADGRAWLDQWARLHLIPVLEHPEPPTPALVRPLIPAGSPA
ncbi:hypothetical protein ACFQ0G_53730 [Streptomyces chiangmaiensis]|uniref:hypothetical protein n=1 Tax=Streptomyces chiangmaiensis TaxID=766497 RepID=UPI0031E56C87